jgi:hypothetical protein
MNVLTGSLAFLQHLTHNLNFFLERAILQKLETLEERLKLNARSTILGDQKHKDNSIHEQEFFTVEPLFKLLKLSKQNSF